MTRLGAALGALMLAACGGSRPAAVTVAPISVSSAKGPEAVVEERYDDLGCGVFTKDGVTPSAGALRRCLERTAPKDACADGGSPDLATLELSVALVDGTGGPVDVPRARKLLEGCFVDISVQVVLAHAAKKDTDPATKPFDMCENYAHTTLAATDCSIEHTQNERAWMRHIRRELALDQKPLFDAATTAFEAYAKKLGEVEYQRYAGGTTRALAMTDRIRYLLHERRVRLAAIRSFVPGEVTTEDRAAARDAMKTSLDSARYAQPDASAAVEEASRAYLPYRDAEVALYESMHPGSREAVVLLLGREHAAHLCATVPP